MHNPWIMTLVIALVSFGLGSIPFGLLISKHIYHTDIRSFGSGNIGATNAMRLMGKKGGSAVFILDFSKGFIASLIAARIAAPLLLPGIESPISYSDLLALSFLGATSGHIFSPWLKFKGGKGIAVAIGCLFVVYGTGAALLELLIFIVLVFACRYVSLGSIASAAACPFFGLTIFWGDWPAVILCALTGSLVVWAHRDNIRRLSEGTERRIDQKD